MKRKADNLLEVVWTNGEVVAEILHSGPIYFRYKEGWLDGGLNLSPISMPFDGRTFNGHDLPDGLPGVLSDSLPDAWGRKVAQCVFARSGFGNVTPMKLMTWIGNRGIGALSFRPAADRPLLTGQIFASSLARQARSVITGDVDAIIDAIGSGGSAGGIAPKALVTQLADGSLRLRESGIPESGSKQCILKLQTGCACAPAIERAYLEMAARAGIATPTSRILVDDEDNRHLLIERFDVEREGRRLHAHTLSGLLHAEKSGLDYADLFRATSRLLCSRDDVLQVARRMIFNVLAANQDDHGKNHSFLLDDKSRAWRLAPAYDLTYSPGISRGMSISGEVVPEVSTLRALCLSAGLKDEEFGSALEQIRAAINAWSRIASEHGVQKTDIKEIGKTLQKLDGMVRKAASSADVEQPSSTLAKAAAKFSPPAVRERGV